MKTKLILCDFDGTITSTDVLDALCDLVGQGKESAAINSRYQSGKINGRDALIHRFSMLEGIKVTDIFTTLGSIPLTEGVHDFFSFASANKIEVLVLSGNASFVLDFFSKKLGFRKFYGSTISINNGIIQKWNNNVCRCVDKYLSANLYIKEHNIAKENIIAIGDSIADEGIFSLANMSFLINKKTNVYADFEVENFYQIINILKRDAL